MGLTYHGAEALPYPFHGSYECPLATLLAVPIRQSPTPRCCGPHSSTASNQDASAPWYISPMQKPAERTRHGRKRSRTKRYQPRSSRKTPDIPSRYAIMSHRIAINYHERAQLAADCRRPCARRPAPARPPPGVRQCARNHVNGLADAITAARHRGPHEPRPPDLHLNRKRHPPHPAALRPSSPRRFLPMTHYPPQPVHISHHDDKLIVNRQSSPAP